jgi:hypothetical protein
VRSVRESRLPATGVWPVLVLSCAAALAAATPAIDVRPPAPAPEGCYDVRVGLWLAVTDQPVDAPRLPPERSSDSTAYVLPPRVRLTNRPLKPPVGVGWLSAAAPEGALPTGHRYQAWHPSPEGGILLWFAAARSGVRARLDQTESGFEGRLRTFDVDERAQLYERDVWLARVDCASAPPTTADALRPLPRAVRLAGGATLLLGAPAPDGLEVTPRPSGATGVTGRTVGLFAGSDSIAYRIGANDGTVGVVQLIFPGPATGDTLIARITREFGPPDQDTAVPGAWWHNRITEVSVITSHDGGYRVLLQDPRSW